jgi:major membrane immunogen (membrane-anchored lipoprotein)
LRNAIIVALLVLLTGCTTHWIIPPGGTQQEFQKDDYECRKEAVNLTSNDDVVGVVTFPAWYKKCMKARGYTLEK